VPCTIKNAGLFRSELSRFAVNEILFLLWIVTLLYSAKDRFEKREKRDNIKI